MNFTQIVIFGGWNHAPATKAYILREDKEILEIRTPEGRDALPIGDFFLTNGDTVCVETTHEL